MSDVLYRAMPVTLERAAGEDGRRRLTGRLVPYNEVADVVDIGPNGERDLYREGFRPGAFDPQVRGGPPMWKRIKLVHSHEQPSLGFLGYFNDLREGADGLYGSVNVRSSMVGEVDELLEAGINELSVEFHVGAPGHTDTQDGVRWRRRAHLHQVALEPKGAYSRAEVLSFRAAADEQAAQVAAEAAQAAQEAAEAQQAAEATERADRAAQDAQERRRRFEELVAEAEAHTARQAELAAHYGVTVPDRRFGPVDPPRPYRLG